MKSSNKRSKRVNAPAAPFFLSAVFGILFNAKFEPGLPFWRILFIFSISLLLVLTLTSYLWKNRERLRLRKDETFREDFSLSFSDRSIEPKAAEGDLSNERTPLVESPLARRDVYENEYWKNWLETELNRDGNSTKSPSGSRVEKGRTWNDALVLFLKERRNEVGKKSKVCRIDEVERRGAPFDDESSAFESQGASNEITPDAQTTPPKPNFFSSLSHRVVLRLQSVYFYVNLCAWLAFFALCGQRHEAYYNYFPQDEIGLLATEDALGTTLELRVGKTPVLYEIKDAERSALGNDKTTSFTAQALRVKNAGNWQKVSGRVDVSVNGDATRLRIGDRIVVSGKLARPKKQGNPGERDRVFYYRSQRVLSTFSVNSFDFVEIQSESRFPFLIRVARMLEKTRLLASRTLRANLSRENAAVACGMTFGFRNEVDDETNDAFRRTGVVHLLAISGLHVVLVVGLFVSILRRLNCPETIVSVATLFLVFFYLGLTDMRAPVIRATILIVVANVGFLIGRRGVTLNTLAFAAVALLLLNPCELFQVGAQLSFLATGVFLWSSRITASELAEASSSRYAAILERRRAMAQKKDEREESGELKKVATKFFIFRNDTKKNRSKDVDVLEVERTKNAKQEEQRSTLGTRVRYVLFSLGRRIGGSIWGKLRAATVAGCAVWATSVPLLLRTTNLATPIAVVANPIVWIPATLALTFAFLLAFAGLGSSLAPGVFGAIVSLLSPLTDLFFSFLLGVVELLARPSFGSFHTSAPPVWTLVLFYAPLVFLTLFPHLRPKRRVFLPLFALWTCSFWLSSYYEQTVVKRNETLRVEVLSIGHGVAVVGLLPDGRSFLCDCGSTVGPRRAARIVSKILWDAHRSSIDLAIVSHADFDHYCGFLPLLELVPVDRVCFSPYSLAKNGDKLTELLKALQRAGTRTETVVGGETLARLGFPELAVLHPVDDSFDDAEDSSNANSLVVSLSYLGRNFLFPGDLDVADVPFLQTPSKKYDLILAPHHGGKSESCQEILDWSDPTWTVISGGTFVRNRALEEELRQKGRLVAHTMDDGCVRIEARRSPVFPNGRGRTTIKTFRSERVYESGDF